MVTYYAIYALNTVNGEWMLAQRNFRNEWAAKDFSKIYTRIGFEVVIKSYEVKEW